MGFCLQLDAFYSAIILKNYDNETRFDPYTRVIHTHAMGVGFFVEANRLNQQYHCYRPYTYTYICTKGIPPPSPILHSRLHLLICQSVLSLFNQSSPLICNMLTNTKTTKKKEGSVHEKHKKKKEKRCYQYM